MAAYIKEILAHLEANHKFGIITRYDYTANISVEDLMQEIEAVGKFRDPKFVIDDENRFAYTNLAKWLLGDPTMECINPETKQIVTGSLTKGIYLAGNTGSGKTWAMDIISYLGSAHKFKINSFGKDSVLDMACTYTFSAVEKYLGGEDPLTQKVLCFNDLGTEMKEAVYMGNRCNVMADYIEERGEGQYLITCFTSNIPMEHPSIKEFYGDRAVSRLRQMCNYLEMKGADRRK